MAATGSAPIFNYYFGRNMKSVDNFASTLPISINIIPLTANESVYGNCSNWKGPRERNGRKSFICLDGSKGTCQHKMRDLDFEYISGALTSPVSGDGCSHWKFVA
ncbi:hypothetical protein [Sulfuricella sp. T08]|uniref:hypothetical protein n=1 Tax=Sulfuricella sp. T08 TaxID=1632857 RepID=UPI001186766B|nr:hypothetical protein [Sulfuricella sp. T08]